VVSLARAQPSCRYAPAWDEDVHSDLPSVTATHAESGPPPVSRYGARSAWRVVSSRNFGPYFVGSAASASGTWFDYLAASVVVYELTHSAVLLGVLAFCQFFPVLVFAPWAGRVADGYNRRSVLLVTQPAAAVTSAALAVIAYAGHATVAIVLAFSLCLGSLNAFTNAAQMAMVPSLVARPDVPQAVALNLVELQGGRIWVESALGSRQPLHLHAADRGAELQWRVSESSTPCRHTPRIGMLAPWLSVPLTTIIA